MSGTQFLVRPATVDDMDDVANMIREYAEFDEGVPEGPKISCGELVRDGFESPNPMFHCIVAQLCNGPNIGYAVYFFTYSSWLGQAIKLEDLYVTQKHRRNGVGTALFNNVAKVAMENMCCRLDCYVLEGTPAVQFYEERGAEDITTSENWRIYCLRDEALNLAASQAI